MSHETAGGAHGRGAAKIRMRLEDALGVTISSLRRLELEDERVHLMDSDGRILGRTVKSREIVPGFDKAAVDGFAVRLRPSEAMTGPRELPERLKVVGKLVAGANPLRVPKVSEGQAAEVMTGAPMPSGGNAVVMKEFAERVGDEVRLNGSVAIFQNVSRKGEDYRKGDVIVPAGTVLRPWHLAALAGAGMGSIPVRRRLRAGILSTGSELVEVGRKPRPGQLVNSNKPMLSWLVQEMGCEAVDLGIAPDEREEIRDGLEKGVATCDLLLTTGGSSVGERDLVPAAVRSLKGHAFLVEGVSMRPGSATKVAKVGPKPVFILSGYPAAAQIAFEAVVAPTIHFLRGTEPEPFPTVAGRLARGVSNRPGFRSFIRVVVSRAGDGYTVTPPERRGAGLVSSLAGANGVLVLDEGTAGKRAGDEVSVRLVSPILPPSGRGEQGGNDAGRSGAPRARR